MTSKKIRILGLIFPVAALAAFLLTCSNPAGPGNGRQDLRQTAPVLPPSAVYTGTLGVAFSNSLPGTAGNPASTWAVTEGVLPAGLELNGRIISGIPAAAGTANVTVTAANSVGASATEVTITINPAAIEPGQPGHPTQPGRNLVLKGQVWYLDDDTKNYFHFMGDRADIKAYVNGGYVASEPNGTGAITGGQLNFNIGIPTVLLPSDEMKTALQDAVISPAETQFNVFFNLIAERNEMPTLYSVASSGTPDVELTEVFGCVIFLYVDQDATMSSAGSEWFDDTCSYGNTFLVKYEPYTINLHEGWNIITVREDRVTRPANYISTYSVSLGSPADAEWRMCLGVPPPKPFLQM